MARTFTGLKLQGQLGKFGRIAISDISAYVELPDGKVLSGTEWGNLLLWDGGFIKVEISKKGKKLCHNVSTIACLSEEWVVNIQKYLGASYRSITVFNLFDARDAVRRSRN